MSLRSRVAAGRFARAAALPIRAKAAGGHAVTEMGLATHWLFTSREHHNFTYDLTERNIEHLAWWVAVVTGADVAQCRQWLAEALSDELMMDHVRRTTARATRAGLADSEVRIGRRAGWYAVIRATQPEHVIETGTDKGLGSVVIAAALLRNGHGSLTTIDINPAAGYLITGPYAEVTSVVIGDSVEALNAQPPDVGLFIHDSDHSAEHETRELAAVAGTLLPGAVVLSDNAHSTDSLVEWAAAAGRRFLYFQEQPKAHWYPGAGIGAAW